MAEAIPVPELQPGDMDNQPDVLQAPEDGQWTVDYLRGQGFSNGDQIADERFVEAANKGEKVAQLRAKFLGGVLHRKELQSAEEKYEQASLQWKVRELELLRAEGGKGVNERLKQRSRELAADEVSRMAERELHYANSTHRGRFLRWYNSGGIIRKIGVGVVIGAATTGLSIASGGTAVIGTAAFFGARAARGALVGGSRMHLDNEKKWAARADKHSQAAAEGVEQIDEGKSRKVYGATELAQTANTAVQEARSGQRSEARKDRAIAVAKALGWTAVGVVAGRLVSLGLHDQLRDLGIGNNDDVQASRPSAGEHSDHIPGTGADHAPEVPSGEIADTPAPPTPVDTSQYQYPWNWAEATAGQGNGSQLMFDLADRARLGGHQVEWHNVVNGDYSRAWISVDGHSDTDYVVNTLNQYNSPSVPVPAPVEAQDVLHVPSPIEETGNHYVITNTEGAGLRDMHDIAETAINHYMGDEPSNRQVEELVKEITKSRKSRGLPLLLDAGERIKISREEIEQALANATRKSL